MPMETPNAVLCGGPLTDSPVEDRLRYVDFLSDSTVKLLMGNRYEHFRPVSEVVAVGDRELPVLAWSHRTYVAE